MLGHALCLDQFRIIKNSLKNSMNRALWIVGDIARHREACQSLHPSVWSTRARVSIPVPGCRLLPLREQGLLRGSGTVTPTGPRCSWPSRELGASPKTSGGCSPLLESARKLLQTGRVCSQEVWHRHFWRAGMSSTVCLLLLTPTVTVGLNSQSNSLRGWSLRTVDLQGHWMWTASTELSFLTGTLLTHTPRCPQPWMSLGGRCVMAYQSCLATTTHTTLGVSCWTYLRSSSIYNIISGRLPSI